MARDVAAVMRGLGHDRCSLVGHDRGARVAYRMALDMPECVDRVVLIDILPTAEVWSGLRAASAVASYHWSFLAQPAPIPETLIGGAPDLYAEHTLKSWTQAKSLACFDPVALEHYRALLRDPRRVHAICEDYRAGWTVDRALDEADQAAGRRIAAPALVLWGSDYVGKGAASPLEVWRRWAVDVTGEEIMSGHFLAEESADQTLAAVLGFLGRG
jgi:haloacetate dehalogenase